MTYMRTSMDPKSRLADGNAMFKRTMDPALLRRISETHEPFVAVLTCSDARADPVKVFNLSLGDAFVVRSAGNTVNDLTAVGSLEYAVKHLKVKMVLVMGHSDCGAVKATYGHRESGHLDVVLDSIDCAKSKLDDSLRKDISAVAESNVRLQLRKLEDSSSIIRDAVSRGELELCGAVLDLKTGAVRFI